MCLVSLGVIHELWTKCHWDWLKPSESFLSVCLEAYVDSDADVDCINFEIADRDVDVDAES